MKLSSTYRCSTLSSWFRWLMLSSLEVLNGRAHPVIAKDDLRKAAKILIYRSRKKIRSKIRKPPKLLLPEENAENTPHSPRRRGTTQILTTTGTLYPRSCTPGSTRFSNHEVDSNRHDFGRCDLSGSRQPPAARRVGSFRCYHGRAARRLDTNRICGWRTGMASRYQCPAAPEAGIT